MRYAEYSKLAAKYDKPLGDSMQIMDDTSLVLGIVTEAAEIADIYKKRLAQGKSIDKEHLAVEIGDLIWYIRALIDTNGLNFGDILNKNIEKLQARYGETYDREKALLKQDKLNGGY